MNSKLLYLINNGMIDKKDAILFKNAYRKQKLNQKTSLKERLLFIDIAFDLIDIINNDNQLYNRFKMIFNNRINEGKK